MACIRKPSVSTRTARFLPPAQDVGDGALADDEAEHLGEQAGPGLPFHTLPVQ